jgi:hypothetical protein
MSKEAQGLINAGVLKGVTGTVVKRGGERWGGEGSPMAGVEEEAEDDGRGRGRSRGRVAPLPP